MCRCINCFITWHNLLRVERGYRRYKIYELSLHYRFKSHASGGDGKKKNEKEQYRASRTGVCRTRWRRINGNGKFEKKKRRKNPNANSFQ